MIPDAPTTVMSLYKSMNMARSASSKGTVVLELVIHADYMGETLKALSIAIPF